MVLVLRGAGRVGRRLVFSFQHTAISYQQKRRQRSAKKIPVASVVDAVYREGPYVDADH